METIPCSNTPDALASRFSDGLIPYSRIAWMLALRSLTAFSLLIFLALVFRLEGRQTALADASAWWLWFVTAANAVSLFFLIRFGRREGVHLQDLYSLNRATWKADLGWSLGALIIVALVAQFPGDLLARLLWGDVNAPTSMLLRPLPLAAIYPLFILVPSGQALAELPLYWGYVAPRLRAIGMSRGRVLILVASVLSVQHLFFSFQWEWRYDLWLAVRYLPFALWTGFVVERRPTTLPYLMAAHFLIDATLPVLLLLVSQGVSLAR